MSTPHSPNLVPSQEAIDAVRSGRWATAPRRSLACLMVQVPAIGDDARRRVEEGILCETGPDDLLARLRDDVYLMILSDRRLLAGMLFAEALRHRIGGDGGVPTRVGVVALEARHLSIDALELAEGALDLAREIDVPTVSWDMVELDAILNSVRGEDVLARFASFIEAGGYLLGPAQLRDLRGHADDVGRVAERLARKLQLQPADVVRCRVAGTLHDIGKTAIPEELLARASSLAHPEWMLVARHAELGAGMAARLGAETPTVEAIRHHHTPFDAPVVRPGLGARIVAVAETVAAITSEMPYAAARTADEALTELARGSGTRYDPRVVRAAHELGASAIIAAAG